MTYILNTNCYLDSLPCALSFALPIPDQWISFSSCNKNHVWSLSSLQNRTPSSRWREDASRLCVSGRCPQPLPHSSVRSLSQSWIFPSLCLPDSSKDISNLDPALRKPAVLLEKARSVPRKQRRSISKCDTRVSLHVARSLRKESSTERWNRERLHRGGRAWAGLRDRDITLPFPTLATGAQVGVLRRNTNIYWEAILHGGYFLGPVIFQQGNFRHMASSQILFSVVTDLVQLAPMSIFVYFTVSHVCAVCPSSFSLKYWGQSAQGTRNNYLPSQISRHPVLSKLLLTD